MAPKRETKQTRTPSVAMAGDVRLQKKAISTQISTRAFKEFPQLLAAVLEKIKQGPSADPNFQLVLKALSEVTDENNPSLKIYERVISNYLEGTVDANIKYYLQWCKDNSDRIVCASKAQTSQQDANDADDNSQYLLDIATTAVDLCITDDEQGKLSPEMRSEIEALLEEERIQFQEKLDAVIGELQASNESAAATTADVSTIQAELVEIQSLLKQLARVDEFGKLQLGQQLQDKVGALAQDELKGLITLNLEDLLNFGKRFAKTIDWGIPELVKHFVERHIDASEKPSSASAAVKSESEERTVNIFDAIDEKLASDQQAAISGTGGVGKTQVAIAYTRRCRDEAKYDYDTIVWLTAEGDVSSGYRTFAEEKLGVPVMGKSQEDVIQIVNSRLQERKKILFVFDNVKDYDDIADFIPPSTPQTCVNVLMTSRNQLVLVGKTKNLPAYRKDEAIRYIKERLQNSKITTTEKDIRNLAKTLYYFPLAIAQALAYILQTPSIKKLDDYLIRYKNCKQRLLQKRTLPKNEYTRSVWTSLEMSIEAIAEKAKAGADYADTALDILDMCAYLAPEGIPQSLFTSCFKDVLEQDDGFEALYWYSLLEGQAENMHMHRLLQEVLRLRVDARAKPEAHLEAQRLATSAAEAASSTDLDHDDAATDDNTEKMTVYNSALKQTLNLIDENFIYNEQNQEITNENKQMLPHIVNIAYSDSSEQLFQSASEH